MRPPSSVSPRRTLLALLIILGAGCASSALSASPTAPAPAIEIGPARIGQPLTLRFKAADGRDVDLRKMKGKVVLVDFWATWCGPCLRELPNLKATYDRLHDQGFEIIGVSFDQRKEALNYVLKKEKIPWPQYFDGRGWDDSVAKKFGLESLPSLWLIDRQGNLRQQNVRTDLTAQIEKLLAEP